MPEQPEPKHRPHPFRTGDGRLGTPAAHSSQPTAPPYAELHVTTNFTFLTGASHPEEYVEQARDLGHRAVAVTDVNSLAGVVRAHIAAKHLDMPFIVGCRLEMTDPDLQVLVYPTDRASYGRLCRLLTVGRRRAPKGECHLSLHDLIEHQEGLLAAVIPPGALDQSFIEVVEGLRRTFDDDRLSIATSCLYGEDDRTRLHQLIALAAHTRVPLVATNDVHYHAPERRALQDIVTCIRHGCMIHEAGFRLFPHAERHLKPAEEMARLFAEHPQAVERTVHIAERAAGFDLDQLRYEYPREICPDGMDAMTYLKTLTWRGAAERYGVSENDREENAPRDVDAEHPCNGPPPSLPPRVLEQIRHEFDLIEELRYAPYFLTCYDIVRFARSRGILCQGRGAAANSAVCYCLGVTAVDPERVDLLFERFVSRERNEPPDIDIDFEHERREEVIQYIYRKYGRDRAALTAEVITYRGRSAVREVGKALGLSLDCVDRLSKSLDWWDKGVINEERLRGLGVNPRDATVRHLVHLAGEILGFPRHLSQHVGGFVITEGPLCESVPIENAAMDDRTVIEWDKDDIDALGMLKIDVLGLGMLTCISKALGLVNGAGATERRSDEATEGARKRSRHVGASTRRKVEVDSHALRKETGNGESKDVSRSDRLAAWNGVGENCLQDDNEDARRREIRSDDADAAGGCLSSFQHRRRTCPADAKGLPATPPNRPRITRGTGDSVRTGEKHGLSPTRRGAAESPCGDRSSSSGTHSQSRTTRSEGGLTPFVAPSLRRSVAPPLDLHTIPPEDPLVYDMLCRADAIGVFQVESRAQMAMLPRLRPREYYDLVIEVAIVRPGPIQGKMVHPYLRRRAGEEAVTYPDEKVKRVLGKTLGVPLFQEQAMQLAIVAAGFTPDEADQLRRAMAAWKRKGNILERFGERLVNGMLANGYDRGFAERCFEQIKGFSEYGFPESHAASFAHLVYASAWLKRHHPAAFAAALINSQPMGFYAPAQIIRDAREHGVEVRPLDINHSDWDCTLEDTPGRTGERRPAPALRLGMRLVKGLREDDAQAIADAVDRHGPFRAIDELRRHAGVRIASMRKLAQADAFTSMGLTRQQALWEVRGLRDEALPLFDANEGPPEERDAHGRGFQDNATNATSSTPPLPDIPPSRQVIHDYASTGLSLKAHPVSFIRDHLDARGVTPSGELEDESTWTNGRSVAVAGITLVRQRPGTASGIVFMTIEDETGVANLIIRPKVYQRFRKAARHGVVILARGTVERQGQVVHIMVREIEDLDDTLRDLSSRSRDFH